MQHFRVAIEASATRPRQAGFQKTVERAQASIQRGQKASFAVKVAATDGAASGVSIALATQPSGLGSAFVGGCGNGEGTEKCTVGSVAKAKAVAFNVQVPVASGASSVTSVKLTATANATTASSWTPPSATVTVGVTAASSRPASAAPGTSANIDPIGNNLSIGLAPGVITSQVGQLIGASNASGLFPAINPSSATPSPSPGLHPQASSGSAQSVADASALGLGKPVLTAQVAGLIALALGVLLTVTRLSVRRRPKSPK